MRIGLLIAMLLLSGGAFAHEHHGKHAASAEECKSMAKGKEQSKCMTCVEKTGHHYHLNKKMKGGDRCHDDAHDPMDKKKT